MTIAPVDFLWTRPKLHRPNPITNMLTTNNTQRPMLWSIEGGEGRTKRPKKIENVEWLVPIIDSHMNNNYKILLNADIILYLKVTHKVSWICPRYLKPWNGYQKCAYVNK